MKKYMSLMMCVGLLIGGMAMKEPTEDTNIPNFPKKQVSEILSPEKGGVLRGASFNMGKEQIAHLEIAAKEYMNKKRFMAYTVKLSSEEFEFADIYYQFDKDGLFMVTVETFQDKESSAANLFRSIKKHYDKVLGNSYLAEDGYLVWLGKDEATKVEYEIALLDVSNSEDAGIYLEYYVVTE